MAVIHIRALRCDTQQCDTEWLENVPTWSDREFREQMRARGWVRRRLGGRLVDRCPDCAAGRRGPHWQEAP
jgi:hypothetical protein